MNIQNILNLMTEEAASLALQEYLDSKSRKAEMAIAATSTLINSYDEDTGQYTKTAADILNEFEQEGLMRTDCLMVKEGFISVRDLVSNMGLGAQEFIESGEDEITVPVTNAEGVMTFMPAQSVINQLQQGIYNAKALSVASAAMVKGGSISDKLSYFSTNFSSKASAVKDSVKTYYSRLISNSSDFGALINTAFRDGGVSDLANGSSPAEIKMDVIDYTGSTFASGMVADMMGDAISNTGKVIGAAFVGIWRAVSKTATSLFNWAIGKVNEILVNPYDVKDNGNKDSDYTFQGFQYQYRHSLSRDFIHGIIPGDHVNEYTDIRDKMDNNWFTLDTIGGIISYRFNSVQIRYNEVMNVTEVYSPSGSDFTSIMKPRPLLVGVPHGFTNAKSIDMIASDIKTSLPIYGNTDLTEDQLYNCFLRGIDVLFMVQDYIINGDIIDENNGKYYSVTDEVTNVSNADWLKLACGWNPTTGNFDTFPTIIYVRNTAISTSTDHGVTSFFGYIEQTAHAIFWLLKLHHDDAAFIPYLSDTQLYKPGRFSIKTDTENERIASAFMTTVIMIAIVATVAISGAVIIRKIRRHFAWKRTEFIGQMDAKMWDGQQLTKKEKRKYIRYNRKGDILSMLDDSESSGSESYANTSTVNGIYKLISGEDPE